jgi:hypothetical protein
VNNPSNSTLPFFAYGLFKPGQLGFERIEQPVHDCRMHCATVGTLWIRDGIPLLEPGGNNTTFGALVYFRPADAALAYQRISEIEPDEQYYWGEIDATYRTSHRDLAETANALIGRKPQRGSRGFEGVDWDGRDDPLFNEGLDVIEETLNKNREFHDDLKRLFRLQMAYLLLWSAIERYAGLRYHLGRGAMKKVTHIAAEPVFIKAVSALPEDATRWVYRGDKPGQKALFVRDNPDKTLDFYYQVRSNMVHRGKAEYSDFAIVRQALSELLPIFRTILDDAFKPHPVWH